MSDQIQRLSHLHKTFHKTATLLLFIIAVAIAGGCATTPKTRALKYRDMTFNAGTIIETRSGKTISFETLMADLVSAEVVYVGEHHINPDHHRIQLDIIKALFKKDRNLSIGMEMFDFTYQPILDRWVSGELDRDEFLRRTHWYANWRYNFDLYSDILENAKEHHLKVIGLNIPFHIPPKISIGGIESLGSTEKDLLPENIDTGVKEHRAYVEKIYKFHRIKGRDRFDNFYQAQCVWEDTMASQVAKNSGRNKMVVIAGNGHIINKFGIPDRAFARSAAPFKTIYLAPEGSEAEQSWADYIWVTRSSPHMNNKIKKMMKKKK